MTKRAIVLPLSRLRGACREQMDIVRAHWPDGIPLTRAAAAKAARLRLDTYWAADHLLTPETQPEWLEVNCRTWAVHNAAVFSAAAAYRLDRTDGAKKRKAYTDAKEVAWKVFFKARADALLRLLVRQETQRRGTKDATV